MRKKGIVIKLISCFLVAIIVPLTFLSIMSIQKSHSVLTDNMQLTSFQTLKESKNSFELYLKNLGQQLNILTRKNELKHMEDSGSLEDNVTAIEDSIVAALKTTEGALRGYYATNSGKVVTAWYTVENGKNIPHHTLENDDYTDKPWFKNAIGSSYRNGVYAVFTEPYIDPTTNRLIITVSQEVKANKEQVGCVAIDIPFDEIKKFVQNINLLNTGYVLLANADGTILVDNNRNTFIKSSLTTLPNWDNIKDQNQVNTQINLNGQTVNVVIFNDEITNWKLVGVVSEKEISDSLNTIVYFTLGTALIGIILGIIIAIAVTTMIKRKLNYMNKAVSDVAKGDLSQNIQLIGNDEFTDLANNFNKMITSVSILIRNVDSASHALLKSSDEIATISSETSDSTKNVFAAISDVAHSTTNQAHRIQEASIHVDNLGSILAETNAYINKQLSPGSQNPLDTDPSSVFNDIFTRATASTNIAITKVENIAADSEEVAAAAEEVSDLTKNVNQSLIKLDEHTEELKYMAKDLKAALSHFKLKE